MWKQSLGNKKSGRTDAESARLLSIYLWSAFTSPASPAWAL